MDKSAIITIIIVSMLTVLLIVIDISLYLDHKKAVKKYRGIIIEKRGSRRIKFPGKHQYRNYTEYIVGYTVNNIKYTGSAEFQQSDLKIGQRIDVHYIINEKGEPELVNDIGTEMVIEFNIAWIVGTMIAVYGMLYLKH